MPTLNKCWTILSSLRPSLQASLASAPKQYRGSFYSLQISRNRSTVSGSPKRKVWMYALVGAVGGSTAGGGYAYYQSQQSKSPVINQGNGAVGPLLSKKPETLVSRKVISPTDSLNLKLVLYQYQTCPFCCKVRAFLDYYGFSYDIIEVNPVLRQQMKWTNYRKVPILLARTDKGYQQLNDSTMIISVLSSFMHDQHTKLSQTVEYYPSIEYKDDDGSVKTDVMNKYFVMFNEAQPKGLTKEDINDERKWRKWADHTLVHMLSPNVYRTREEAMQAFNWFSEVGEWEKHFSSWERHLVIYVGAMAMWMIGKRLKKRHNLKDNVRESLYDECNVWVRELKKKKTNFLGGSKPNLGDLAVYGVLNSIEGCDAFKDILSNTQIGSWYKNMKQEVTSHNGSAMIGAR